MSLRETQTEFTFAIAELILWVKSKGWALTLGEGRILTPRLARIAGSREPVDDGMHIRNSNHYRGLAQDLNLFIDGEWIRNGDAPEWQAIGDYWKSMNPKARWGGDFRDANHFSFEWEGIK